MWYKIFILGSEADGISIFTTLSSHTTHTTFSKVYKKADEILFRFHTPTWEIVVLRKWKVVIFLHVFPTVVGKMKKLWKMIVRPTWNSHFSYS